MARIPGIERIRYTTSHPVEFSDALIEACQQAGVLCSSKEGGVRYHPAVVKAKALIERGAIGELLSSITTWP